MSTRLDATYPTQRRSLPWSASRIVGDREIVEDTAREGYLRALGAMQGVPIGNIAAFLRRAVSNLALDHVRRPRTRARHEADNTQDEAVREAALDLPAAKELILHKERVALFRAALRRLPARARRLWRLNCVEGRPCPNIAQSRGISPGTVFCDMKRAMGKRAMGRFSDALTRGDQR